MVFGTQQRLCREAVDGIDITLGGESVKCCDAFKYLGVILDRSLSLNQHIDHVKRKVSKMRGIFSRARPSESANRVFKSMILPVLFSIDVVKGMKNVYVSPRIYIISVSYTHLTLPTKLEV